MSDLQLAELRRQTDWFIKDDPSAVVLVRKVRVEQPGGGYLNGAPVSLPVQEFKLINQSGGTNGLKPGADGTNTSFAFILLGRHDADVAVGDTWTDTYGDGSKWTVTGILPANSYEVKATVTAYGEEVVGG